MAVESLTVLGILMFVLIGALFVGVIGLMVYCFVTSKRGPADGTYSGGEGGGGCDGGE